VRASRHPWLWVPSLYFSQGIPYVIVMTMSVVMYKRLGISNTDIALYTSWLYLPWVIKPLWSPVVDITRTKRFWIVGMQFLVSLGLALVAFSVRGSAFFRWSLFLFWTMAFASATHDIAADGFYMLSLSQHEQAWWVGLRSTFYRTAMIVGSGLLVVLAGVLESKNGLPPVEIPVRASAQAPLVSNGDPPAVRLPAQDGELRVLVQPNPPVIALSDRDAEGAQAVLNQAKAWNREHGFITEASPAPARATLISWWTLNVSGPFGRFLANHFPKPLKSEAASVAAAGNVGVLYLSLSRPPPTGRQVTVTLGRKPRGLEYIGLGKTDQGFHLQEGERLVFDSANWNQPAMAVIQLDPKLKREAGVTFITSSGNIPVAWSITLFCVAGLFLAFSCWHSVMLPRPANDGPVKTRHSFAGEFFATLASFFQKPGVVMAMLFVLLYRIGEARLVMLYFADGPHKTAHYAICTGFMALGMTIPGMWSGWVADLVGYNHFFVWVLCSAVPGFTLAMLLNRRIDPEFGKKAIH
jgi:PAT family beta-lactamase induction signal transducer AmpG